MLRFLQTLPKSQQDHLQALVEREAIKFWRRFERAHKAKTSKRRKRTTAVVKTRMSNVGSSVAGVCGGLSK
jgi:hypothetical protein